MAEPTEITDLSEWLRKYGEWRLARGRSSQPLAAPEQDTVVTASFFEVPPRLLFANEENQDSAANSVAASVIVDATGTQDGVQKGLTCRTCGLSFAAAGEQQQHFKTAAHLKNLQRRLMGRPPAPSGTAQEDETATESNLEAEEDGKEEEGASSSDESAGALSGDEYDDNNPNDWTEKLTNDASASQGVIAIPVEERKLTFLRRGHAWAVRASAIVLERARQETDADDAESEAQNEPWRCFRRAFDAPSAPGVLPRLWTVILLSSGKFAGAVFEGQNAVCHKIFRRYTMRAKRGGAQSGYDAGGKKPKSAGATLRRYGEQALREDVRTLLSQWSRHLEASRIILLAVPKAMRAVLFDGKDAPVNPRDPRVRWVPFAVGRPTYEEVCSVHLRVTTLSFLPAASVEAAAAAAAAVTTSNASSSGYNNSPVRNGSLGGKEGESRISGINNGSRNSGSAADVAGVVKSEAAAPALPTCANSQKLVSFCGNGDFEAVNAHLQHLLARRGSCAESAEGSGNGANESADFDGGANVSDTKNTEKEEEEETTRGLTSTERQTSSASSSSNANAATNVGSVCEGEEHCECEILDIVDMPDGLEQLQTPLHIASALGHASIVTLLLENGADPLRLDVRGRTPYFLADAKEVRDAFRRRRAEAPTQWDWDGAGVGDPLTDDLERKKKQKEREKKKKAKARRSEQKQAAEEEERERAAREEREAEDRKLAELTAAGWCSSCGKPLLGSKQTFHRLDFDYCSTACVSAHRRALAAQAAENRINSGEKK